jgi:hypothetical protein
MQLSVVSVLNWTFVLFCLVFIFIIILFSWTKSIIKNRKHQFNTKSSIVGFKIKDFWCFAAPLNTIYHVRICLFVLYKCYVSFKLKQDPAGISTINVAPMGRGFDPLLGYFKLSLLLILSLASGVFLRFSGFPPSVKINVSKFQFDNGRGPQVYQLVAVPTCLPS